MDDNELRNRFAGMALCGELAAQDARHEGKGTGVVTPDTMEDFARRVWKIADAMMLTRAE